jgi:hypothetical protein
MAMRDVLGAGCFVELYSWESKNGKARSIRYSSHLVLLRFSIVPDTAVTRLSSYTLFLIKTIANSLATTLLQTITLV